MPFYANSDAMLARIIGVSPPAVRKAAERGRLTRRDDGWWDVFQAVREWRAHTWPSLQRPAPSFRPWLDPGTPLTQYIQRELVRRARAEGAVVELP